MICINQQSQQRHKAHPGHRGTVCPPAWAGGRALGHPHGSAHHHNLLLLHKRLPQLPHRQQKLQDPPPLAVTCSLILAATKPPVPAGGCRQDHRHWEA